MGTRQERVPGLKGDRERESSEEGLIAEEAR